ncbi:MAG: glycosyltransferase family 2 protein [Kineosporiaceae bacterium]
MAHRTETALAAFSPGSTVRRTIVLATADQRAQDPAELDRLRSRLAAGGTQLFVLELAGPAPISDLSPATGAFTVGSGTAEQVFAAAPGRMLVDLTHQFHVQFSAPPGLTRTSTLSLSLRQRGVLRSVDLPAPSAPAAQAPPPPITHPEDAASYRPIERPMRLLAGSLVATALGYALVMLIAARRPKRAATDVPVTPARRPWFVVLVPCLDEERVIRASVSRLLGLAHDRLEIMVIDDASSDATAAEVESLRDPRVQLLRRRLPQARQGKGEALNAAYRQVLRRTYEAGQDPQDVIVVVLDADGRLDARALAEVEPYFADPRLAGVQIGVRIVNRFSSRLARMQDVEFVVYTNVFQRARRHLGSVGLGGNGQFMRLSALASLGDRPWSRSLTEDLDLGVRLIAAGWRTDFCPTVDVHQQGVVTLRALLRQRTRWFQGHLQAWRLLPLVLRGAPRRARADLAYHLSAPLLLLIASLLSASFLASVTAQLIRAVRGQGEPAWWMLGSYLLTYLLTVGPSLAFAAVYRAAQMPRPSWSRTALLAHAYVVYALMWYLAGWRAAWRMVLGRTGWAKTGRLEERTARPDRPISANAPRILTLQPTAPAPLDDLVEVLPAGRDLVSGSAPSGVIDLRGRPGRSSADATDRTRS